MNLNLQTGRPRIMLLTTDLRRGGLPNRLAAMAMGLGRRGFEPIVGCLAKSGPLSRDLAEAGVQTFSCDAAGPLDAGCLVRLAGFIRRLNPDLIHASLFHANLAARLVGRLDRGRPIVTCTVTIEIERGLHRWLEALSGGMSDVHVANSGAVAEHLVRDLGFAPDRVRVIANALDVDRFAAARPVACDDLGIDQGEPIVLWAGRMDPIKNLPVMVEIADQLRHEARGRVVLLGEGPERPRIERMIAARGLQTAIIMAPWSLHPAGWMKRASVFVLPSLTEGSSNVLLEAMAAGCAIVASDIPANRELLGDGARGQLCHPRDAVRFVAAIREVLDERPQIAERRRRALEHVRGHHSPGPILNQWAALYDELLGFRGEDRSAPPCRGGRQ